MSSTIAPGSLVHAFVAVDVSSSMRGSKLQQVCDSLEDIIGSNEGNVLFEITTFAKRARIAATGTKSEIRVPDLVKEILASCGGETAFFDAWGEIVERIPDSVFQNDEVQITLLTDGEDNASKRHDLISVQKLMKAKMTALTKFRFIQVGKGANKQVIESLRKVTQGTPTKADVDAIVTDNSAGAIKSALATVRENILLSSRRSAAASGSSSGSRSRSPPPPYEAIAPAAAVAAPAQSAGGSYGANPLLTTRRVASASTTAASAQPHAKTIGGEATQGQKQLSSGPKPSAPALSKSASGSATATGSYKLQ